MRQIVLFILLFYRTLSASSDLLFSEQEDPTLFHHVNVISGHLSLCFQDAEVPGAIPYSLTRTYTSSGALERNSKDTDLKLKKICQDWLIQGGWNFLPHTNLFEQTGREIEDCSFFLTEKNGSFMSYVFKKEKKKISTFEPEIPIGQSLSNLNARLNPQNNRLYVEEDSDRVTMYLADGGMRIYKRYKRPKGGKLVHFQLIKEISPDKHETHYEYDKNHYLIKIRNTSEAQRITFSSVDFNLMKKGNEDRPFHFTAQTSGGQELHYRSITHKDRHYIAEVWGNCRPHEISHYVPGRSGQGARIRSLQLGNKTQFAVFYYEPPTSHLNKKWEKHPDKTEFPIDKVSRIEAQLGPDGETVTLGSFSYFSDHTDVRDCDQILTRYHHDSKRLLSIDYFDELDQLFSTLRFFWEGPHLKAKVLLSADQTPLFSKVFDYDSSGNVFQESFFGNLTGSTSGPFTLKGEGKLEGAESYSKFYAYETGTHLLLEEREEHGLTYSYTYKPGTALITSKITADATEILSREFFLYNENNLLTCEILDDGKTKEIDELKAMTERQIKRYTLHPKTGLVTTLRESYWEEGTEKLLKRIEYTYSSQNQIISETLYDARETYQYTISTDYDSAGRILSKTTPSGYTNHYRYNPQGELFSAKEEGSLLREYQYNLAGLPTSCTEIDRQGDKRETLSCYDAKGRLLSQKTPEGNTTYQRYDPFGHCKETRFASIKDPDGVPYQPTLYFTYDVAGNLASTITPSGISSSTLYNTFRKPIEIIDSDGTTTLHRYNTQGLLVKTIYPDLTSINYSYDAFHRKTSERILSSEGALLAQEKWIYNSFHLLSSIDPDNTLIQYFYDAAGRLLLEQIEERSITYGYDSLGNLETTTKGSLSQIEKHDKAGRVVAQWIEDSLGKQENRITFLYDEEGFKTQAMRITSQGETSDYFEYDAKGRLCHHIDPTNASYEFLYEEVLNDLNQFVLQKTTIDPLLNRTIETYDALGHLVSEEKQNPSKQTLANQNYFYDSAGNQIKRLITVFDKTNPIRQLKAEWKYDSKNRLIQEIEYPGKITSYTYTLRNQIESKRLPGGTLLKYCYDGLGRLIEQISSDHTIHYLYYYGNTPDPIQIDDLIHGGSLLRTYNAFNELIEEKNAAGFTNKWVYDNEGRCQRFSLPDDSHIDYVYEGGHLTLVQRRSPQEKLLYEHHYLNFDPNGHVTQEHLIHQLDTLHTKRDLLERPISQNSKQLNQSTSYGKSGLVLTQTNSLLGTKNFAYDPLNQLIQEEKTSYSFDSLGNPTNYLINDYNQILSTGEISLHYNSEGNPLERIQADETTTYTYDALGRLTTINEVFYTYDPLGRLLKKTNPTDQIFYLYDDLTEIGTCDKASNLLELKVLGLGIQGEIGATIAIELGDQLFAPLHDFSGHIIALIATDGSLFETYPTDAFGKSTLTTQSINPWRFSSKRCETGLIFFGKRFYDPSLGRFLNPDPSPLTDSPNLYLYTFNSPLNRLDLFGLNSDPLYQSSIYKPASPFENISINIPLYMIPIQSNIRESIPCKGYTGQAEEQYVVIFDNFYKIKFTPEERLSGKVNLVDHFNEILPNTGAMIGIITEQNGINTSFREFKKNCIKTMSKIPEGTLYIGRYNPSHGIVSDVWRFVKENKGIETPAIALDRQFTVAIAETIHNINPNLLWLSILHSEAGIIKEQSIRGMTPDQKALLKQHLYILSFGSARPISNKHTHLSINFYSKKDHVTKRFAKDYLNDNNYNIEFLKCETPFLRRTMLFADHARQGETYIKAEQKTFDEARKELKFYDPKTR